MASIDYQILQDELDVDVTEDSEEELVNDSVEAIDDSDQDSVPTVSQELIDSLTPEDITLEPDSEPEYPISSIVSDEQQIEYVEEVYTEEFVLDNYDIEYLEDLYNQGAKFYAVFSDDTETEVEYNDVRVPVEQVMQEEIRLSDLIANATDQHFWDDDNGAHIAQVSKEDWSTAIENDFSDISLQKPYHNILLNSEGILLRRALLNLFGVTRLAISFYDGTGNTSDNVTATFGSTMAQIGKSNTNHVVITSNGVTAYKGDGTLDELTAIVDGANLKNATITGSKIADSTIENSNIKNGTITGSKIAGSTIENSNIKDGTITGAKIQGSTLTDIPYAEIDELKARDISANDIEAATGFVSSLSANSITSSTLVSNQATINDLNVNYAHITNGVIDNANINVANVNGLSANYAHITNGVIDNAKIGHADVNGLSANYATIANLNAASGRIDDLEADHVSTSDLAAETARINTLVANTADLATIRANSAKVTNLTAAELEADHATVGSLDSNYAQIDMANVNNAWIQNGTIKDAAISDGMINSVSANKLTAGTIDASNITVTNLNADNITTGTINGQRIGTGSLSLDKLSEDVYTEAEVDAKLSTMQSQIDGAIETWTGTAVPTLQNSPASSWNTTALKDSHVGDVYFVVNPQSQQNGYNYRFTKSGSTYSWQLIKDSDVTNALQRLTTAEGKITTFDSDISQLKTDTGTLTTKTTSLETRMSDAEADILDKVDTTTFNEVSDTVDSHSRSITQMTTTLSNKADSSTVSSLTTRVSKNEQDISGINSKIGSLESTVETKADGSTVETISSKVNTISDTVDGHTQNISSIVSTQTQINHELDKTIIETVRLYTVRSSNDIPSLPTTPILSGTDLSDIYLDNAGNELLDSNNNPIGSDVWSITKPSYNSNKPNYFYCYQNKHVDGSYTWSNVVKDNATTESQNLGHVTSENLTTVTTKVNNISDTVDGHTSQLSATTTSLTTLRTDFDNLEIGGRNLIAYSGTGKNWSYTTFSDGIYTRSNSTTNENFIFGKTVVPLELNTTYTMSAWVKTNGQVSSIEFVVYDTNVKTVKSKRIPCTTEWTYQTFTFIMPSSWASGTASSNAWNVQFDNNGTKTNGTEAILYIKQPKLEKGNRATDWTPAPEDLEDYADNAANAVPRMGKIYTAQRTFTTAQWKTYGTYGHVEGWTTGSSYNNSHLRVGDRAYLTGVISDQMKGTATIIGEVTAVIPSPAGTSSVGLKSEQLIFGGDAVSSIQTSLSETQTDYATFKQTTQQFESTVGSTYATKTEVENVDSAISTVESRVATAETSIDQNKDQIALRAKSSDVYTKTQTDGLISTEVSNRNAAIQLSADGINTEVSKKADKATIISTINQSAESVKIQASKVEIDGTAIFTAISSDVDDAITDKGYQTASQVNSAITSKGYQTSSQVESAITSKGYATTTQAQGYATTAENNAKAAIPSDISELNNDSGFITSADVPTKVSELTNDSGFQNATQVNTAITSKGYATTTQAQGYASTAKSEAISAAATDATSKANEVNSSLESYKTTVNSTLSSLQNQVDGQIEAWYKSVDPTASNEPASAWTTAELKQRHEGDLYYNISNGHSWRWLNNGGTYSWQRIPDSDAAAALAAAQNAQTSANTKRRIFTTTPTVPYDVGDLWVNGTQIKYANVSRSSTQSYTASDWVLTATDDSNIPTNVSELTNDANYGTTSQIATAKTEAISSANSNTDTKLQSYSTTTQMNSAIGTAKTEAINASYANYGYKYHKDIVIYGDSDKYYPVYFDNNQSDYSQDVPHDLLIKRGYSEQAPSDWYTSTHKGSLTLRVRWNYGGWGVATYNVQLYEWSEQYSTIVGDVLVGNKSGMNSTIYLRGGGTTGALYHLYSDVAFDTTRYGATFPYIGTTTPGTVYMQTSDGNYKWYVDNPLTTPNKTYILSLAAVLEEQYIYISKPSGTNSVESTNTWITANSDSQNTWTTKRPTYNTSYPVLFVAKQKKAATGHIICTTPVKDDTTTIIDGGHIITGTIDASRVIVTNLDASKITTGSLSADRIKANVIDAVNNGTGTINADKINVSALSIGYSQLTNTPTIPTKVSQLSNDSDFVNTDQLSTVIDGQNSVNDRVNESIVNTKILYTTRGNSTIPDAPNTPIVLDSDVSGAYLDSSSNLLLDSNGNAIMSKTWTVFRPSYSQEEPYYFYCYQYEHADGSYTWSNVMRDDATNESFEILSSRVEIVCSSIDYNNSNASLLAKLYVNNVETSGNQYQWFRDGSIIANQTNQVLLVTSSMGINHLYSCTVDY